VDAKVVYSPWFVGCEARMTSFRAIHCGVKETGNAAAARSFGNDFRGCPPNHDTGPVVSGASLLFLGGLGGLAAYVGNANVARGAVRVTFWSALAMGVTAGIGALLGKVLAP